MKHGRPITYRANIIPQSPVLKTTSMVPHDFPVRTYKSLAKVMPGRMLVKKTYTALARTSWLNVVQSDRYLCRMLRMSCFNNRKGSNFPPFLNRAPNLFTQDGCPDLGLVKTSSRGRGALSTPVMGKPPASPGASDPLSFMDLQMEF